MGDIQPLRKSAQVSLDGFGNGTIRFGPTFGPAVWHVTNSQVKTSQPGRGDIPQCALYAVTQDDNGYIDTAYDGSADSCDIPYDLTLGDRAIAVWTGGNAGDTATLTLVGTMET
jgi:hypothetical protein